MSIPDEFLCPITLSLMSDPVIGGDGHTYERAAITQWLCTNPHSPLTRQTMSIQSLKPNFALKTAIERFKKENAPKKAAARKPQTPPQPSAPPVDDLSIAIQLQHAELTRPLLIPATATAPAQQQQQTTNRNKQFLLMCACAAVVILFIVILSRLLFISNN